MTNITQTTGMGFWKTCAIYGLIVGAAVVGMMIVSYHMFGLHSGLGSMVIGFTIMLAIMSLIFFGMRRFRDQNGGGVLKFGKAFLLGTAMSLFAGIAYVLIWEVYFTATNGEFMTVYTDHLIEMEKAKGVTGEALAEFIAKMEKMKADFAGRAYRMLITFSEIFPMGLIVTLVSALFVHNPKIWARKV